MYSYNENKNYSKKYFKSGFYENLLCLNGVLFLSFVEFYFNFLNKILKKNYSIVISSTKIQQGLPAPPCQLGH